MIPEVKLTKESVWGSWYSNTDKNQLPDLFIAYDIYLSEYDEWLSPDKFELEISQTNIKFIKPELKTFNNVSEIVVESEKPSKYRNDVREGIVIKLSDGRKVTESFKIVNKMFERREDFNEELIKNKIIS